MGKVITGLLLLIFLVIVYIAACTIQITRTVNQMAQSYGGSNKPITLKDGLDITFILYQHGKFWIPFVQQATFQA